MIYKILKIEGDTILLGDEDKKILTVSKADFSYDNPEIGDVVQVFQNDDSVLVVKKNPNKRKLLVMFRRLKKTVLRYLEKYSKVEMVQNHCIRNHGLLV